jgi:hypothetical protein
MENQRRVAVWVLVCALGLGLANAAFGQATITADGRLLDNLVECQDAGGLNAWGPTTWTPGSIGAAFNQTRTYNGISPNAEVEADGIAVQSSTLNGSTTFTSVTASGSAYGFVNVGGVDPENWGHVDVESYFFITFQIATAQDYTLMGTLNRDAVSGPGVRLRLRDVDHAVNLQNTTTAGTYDWQGTLSPGTYELQARATSLYAGAGYYNETASYENVVFTLVPEPGALSLLLLGLPLLRRRRTR